MESKPRILNRFTPNNNFCLLFAFQLGSNYLLIDKPTDRLNKKSLNVSKLVDTISRKQPRSGSEWINQSVSYRSDQIQFISEIFRLIIFPHKCQRSARDGCPTTPTQHEIIAHAAAQSADHSNCQLEGQVLNWNSSWDPPIDEALILQNCLTDTSSWFPTISGTPLIARPTDGQPQSLIEPSQSPSAASLVILSSHSHSPLPPVCSPSFLPLLPPLLPYLPPSLPLLSNPSLHHY